MGLLNRKKDDTTRHSKGTQHQDVEQKKSKIKNKIKEFEEGTPAETIESFMANRFYFEFLKKYRKKYGVDDTDIEFKILTAPEVKIPEPVIKPVPKPEIEQPNVGKIVEFTKPEQEEPIEPKIIVKDERKPFIGKYGSTNSKLKLVRSGGLNLSSKKEPEPVEKITEDKEVQDIIKNYLETLTNDKNTVNVSKKIEEYEDKIENEKIDNFFEQIEELSDINDMNNDEEEDEDEGYTEYENSLILKNCYAFEDDEDEIPEENTDSPMEEYIKTLDKDKSFINEDKEKSIRIMKILEQMHEK